MADEDPDGSDGSGDPGAVADELYAVDPADFVARRTELVRRLRADKRRDDAARVAKLRRPSPAAWAVNRLARDHRDELEALVRLGDELRAAQDRALGGGGGAELRHAARARRDAVAALAGAAARLLAQRGGGVDAHLPGVTATLEAASLDHGAGATVLAGRLTTELEPPAGFGGLAVGLPEAPPDVEAGRAEATAPAIAPGGGLRPEQDEVARAAAARARAEAERAVAEATRRAAELAGASRAAAARAGEQRRAVEGAEAEVARLRGQLDAAERALAAARTAADEADRLAVEADRAAAASADLLLGLEGVAQEPEHRWPQAHEKGSALGVAPRLLVDGLGPDPQADA